MTSSEIRQSFLDFFREKQHTIVPSSPLLPDAPNLLFTNAGMNQFVPIFLGQAPCPYSPARAADTQKCIRAGGKHNDLEDVGFDTYHHTFFEMLGNWSFGDYFKKEAIAWAWELVVGRWGFPPSRVYATIYSPGPGDPASLDREAHEHWSEIFIAAGLDPAVHVVHGNKKDNFWMMGDTGPCGPCSELHIDLTPGPRDLDIPRQIAGRNLVNQGDARCIEIWNLVFIQFNANPDGTFVDLPSKHVDTGMGFERVTSMIQGTKGFTDFEHAKISNYETDVFRPIFDELEKLTGKKYNSTLPDSAPNLSEQEKATRALDVAFRVIADHIRTLSFSIADGIQPSNEGRGYVLRRILRRAVRYGRNLGLREPFLGKLVTVLGATMGHIFPEVVAKADLVRKTLTNEEESFLRTLERGINLFEQHFIITEKAKRLRQSKTVGVADGIKEEWTKFPGETAFELHDTYGFPLDLTELMARERGLTVDVDEFNRLMEEQKERGRAAQNNSVVKVARNSDYDGGTKFIYDAYEVETVIRGISGNRISPSTLETPTLIPEATSMYPAMGGQIGDTGTADITLNDGKTLSVSIKSVERIATGSIFHDLDQPITGVSGLETIRIKVDQPRRAKIEAHHSGTHLMNWALRKVLGNTITQKGSYVGPDRLRFDFSHGTAMTPAEIAEVEKLVNEQIAADVPVKWEERPYAEVKGDPSILQFFGDKYGDQVRVVSIGDFSKELCGGTHVRHSNQVGYFKILHEAAIAAGIRRIEAMSGEALRVHLNELLQKQEAQVAAAVPAAVPSSGKAEPTAARDSGGYLGATTESLPALWQLYKDNEKLLHDLELQRIQHEKDAAKQQEATFQKRAAETAPDLIASAIDVNGVPFLAVDVEGAPAAYLPVLADALKTRWQGIAVLATVDGGKVALLAAVAPVYTKKVQAGKIIQAIAPLVGGKGGGRPELAQGGGTNPAGLASALAKAEEFMRAV
jgi:alanyl-tRNA synthetase